MLSVSLTHKVFSEKRLKDLVFRVEKASAEPEVRVASKHTEN
jgi:hypothetical protein